MLPFLPLKNQINLNLYVTWVSDSPSTGDLRCNKCLGQPSSETRFNGSKGKSRHTVISLCKLIFSYIGSDLATQSCLQRN